MDHTGSKPITATDVERIARQAQKEGYPYLFSVVIAVYNAEEYLEETVDSVVSQTIGFDHTQVILVNDGSKDGSEGICLELERRYPHNVTVVSQENSGVSAARNAGLARVKGKFVNFLDSDDKWTGESFAQTLAYFEEHPDVDVAAARFVFFDAKTGDHRLNYKFDADRVIDLAVEYDAPQLSASTCFFRAPSVEGRRFCEELAVSEDTRFVNEILLDTMKYGVMREPTYLYRQRQLKDSAIDTMKEKRSWYFETPLKCHAYLFELCESKHGSILPFIQYTVMYDLQWRVRAQAPESLTADELDEYRAILEGLLAHIDDRIIAEQRTISIDQVAFTVALKYGTDLNDVLDHLSLSGDMVVTHIADRSGARHDVELRAVTSMSNRLTIYQLEIRDGHAVIEGYITTLRYRPQDAVIAVEANNRPVEIREYISDIKPLQNPFDDTVPGKTAFTCRIPLEPGQEVRIKASMTLFDERRITMHFRFDEETGFERDPAEGDYLLDERALFRIGASDALVIRRLPSACSRQALEQERQRAEAYRASVLHDEVMA